MEENTFSFSLQITFDNKAHSGRIKVNLDHNVEIKECRDWNVTGTCKQTSIVFWWLYLLDGLNGSIYPQKEKAFKMSCAQLERSYCSFSLSLSCQSLSLFFLFLI